MEAPEYLEFRKLKGVKRPHNVDWLEAQHAFEATCLLLAVYDSSDRGNESKSQLFTEHQAGGSKCKAPCGHGPSGSSHCKSDTKFDG